MTIEKFSTKFFTEILPLQDAGENKISPELLHEVYRSLAGRDLSEVREKPRNYTSFNLLCALIQTPRRYHRFKYALARRIPVLLDEVDDYDLLLIAALEACDSAALTTVLRHSEDIFVRNKIGEAVEKALTSIGGNEEKAVKQLIVRKDDDPVDKYVRAAAKEHWRAAFLGVGSFTSIARWTSFFSADSEEQIIGRLQLLLHETGEETSPEVITDVLRSLLQSKFDVDRHSKLISTIISEVERAGLGSAVTPTLATVVQKKLAVIDPSVRYRVLNEFLSIPNVHYSFISRLFFFLVEDPERGRVHSGMSAEQIIKLSYVVLEHFKKVKAVLDLGEDCYSYLFRVKWASKHLNENDPTVPVLLSKLREPVMMDRFVFALLALRHPWIPNFSDNHIDLIDKLVELANFFEIVVAIDYSKVNKTTENVLTDFRQKYEQAQGRVEEVKNLFD